MPQSRRPKLAQHFLTDARYRRRIVGALDLRLDDLVIEIGAGRGAMTELLAERAPHLIAIELDADLAEKLAESLGRNPRVEVIQADILATDLAELCRRLKAERCLVFGNLPYYITSPILQHLFRFWSSIRAMALVMQREVAERLAAAPGTRDYGYLSVLAQLHSQPRIALSVPPGAFSPPPKVQSALVDFQMQPKFRDWSLQQEKKFVDFVKACFAQKRKKLLNNLRKIYTRQRAEEALRDLNLPPAIRAEQLTIEQFVILLKRLG